jgi:hypothetical protein
VGEERQQAGRSTAAMIASTNLWGRVCSGSGLRYRHFETFIGVWVSHMHFNLGRTNSNGTETTRRCISGNIYMELAARDGTLTSCFVNTRSFFLIIYFVPYACFYVFHSFYVGHILEDTMREVLLGRRADRIVRRIYLLGIFSFLCNLRCIFCFCVYQNLSSWSMLFHLYLFFYELCLLQSLFLVFFSF